MKVTAVIAEYNPFHNGHLYQLREARRLTGADFIVIVLGGNFMQRGGPALLDKSARAKAALSCGADLVVELPVRCACGSAEFFAGGAAALLNAMNCVDFLCFGSECGNLSELKAIAAILAEEPALFKDTLSACLKAGDPFPKARESAVWAVLAQAGDFFKETPSVPPAAGAGDPGGNAADGRARLHALLAQPNNILAVEYCKALRKTGSAIEPVCVPRRGTGHHGLRPAGDFCSASAIRAALLDPAPGDPFPAAVTDFLPEASADILIQEYKKSCPVCPDDFSSMLSYRLLQAKDPSEFSACFDVPEPIARRIFSLRKEFTGFDSFVNLVKTRNFTETAVRRSLLHILLALPARTEDARGFFPYYFRVLGFCKSAAPLLRTIKEKGRLPLLTKPADAPVLLSSYERFSPEIRRAAAAFWEAETRASLVYAAAVNCKFHREAIREYASPVILP